MTLPAVYPHALALLTQLVVEPAIKAPYLTTAGWLRDFFSWPDERRREWRQARLAEVVGAAASAVPYYRDILGGSATGVTLEDLPVVSKAVIRPQLDRFLADGWRDMPHISKRTGGTTGDPWQYPLDKRAWTQMYASSIHLFERTGYRYGERVVLLGAPASLGLAEPGLKTRLRRALERHDTSLAGYTVDRAASADRVARAGAAGASLWYGFAGTIAAMAEAVLEEGLPVRPPRAIVTTAEPLQPAWRERIAAAFGRRPFDQYGCNDGGVMSQTCARGRFHLAENLSIVEVLTGDAPAGPGVEGEVAVTNLHARVLPFLRYKTGDRAVLGEDTCPCGTPGATLERVAGRHVDRLELPDGTHLSGLSFGAVFMRTPHVRRWQVVQEELSLLTVRLDVEPGYGHEEAEIIERGFRDRVGDSVRLQLTTSEPIERTPGGKHRLVVRHT